MNPHSNPIAALGICETTGVEAPAQPLNPWFHIWFAPRAVLRDQCCRAAGRTHWIPAAAGGILTVFDCALRSAWSAPMAPGVLWATIVVVGAVLGIAGIWLFGAVLQGVGQFLGGLGDGWRLRRAQAGAASPSAVSLGVWLVVGHELLGFDLLQQHPLGLAEEPAFVALSAIQGLLGCWAMITLCHTVAEAQGYSSAWRGFINVVGAAALVGAIAVGWLWLLWHFTGP
ncbi:MAG: hypothetical protein ACFCBW_22580 [Candidatus Competibacterales bacterium]